MDSPHGALPFPLSVFGMQRSLDGFSILEPIGFGATGEVWRARPDRGGPDVALTWLPAETVDTELLGAAVLREFRHPHLAPLLDLRRDGSAVVLVQEFIPGVSLAALLAERGRLSSAEVVTLLTPVADVLGAAHAGGLLHGNLTPSAVLLTPDGRPIVTDLGVWPCLSGISPETARLEHLDPAVARGGPLTTASDVFGVAAVGFHALTGRPPRAAGSGAATWQLPAEGAGADVSPLYTGPPGRLADVIARGLSDQPDRRGSAEDFAADVRAALEPEPLHLAGPQLWPDLPPATPSEAAQTQSVTSHAASFDIAGEVRRGSSARHAATPSTRRERAPLTGTARRIGNQRSSRLAGTARVVPRRAVLAAVVALAGLTALVLGLGWNASNAVPARGGGPLGEATSQSSAGLPDSLPDTAATGIDERAVPDSAEDWAAVLTLLYERRALAFATGAVALLGQVYAVDSPQMVADTAELTRLAQAGQVLRGFAPRVLEVSEVRVVDQEHAALQITDEFGGYETVPALDTGAAALANHAGRGPVAVAMTVVLTEGGWRIQAAHRLA